MFESRSIIGAAITTACGIMAFAGPAEAKLAANVGTLIAYERDGDIRVMSDQGAAVFDNALTTTPGVRDGAPSWALPDVNCFKPLGDEENLALGRTLVYESRPAGGDSDIVKARLTGYPPTLVSTENLTEPDAHDEGEPAVGSVFDFADENRTPIAVVVFTRGPVGQRDIWAKFLDGSHETRLTDAPGDEFSPDWSSDGRAVAYETTDAAGTRQVAVVEVGYNSQAEHDSGVVVLTAPRFVTAGTESHGAPSWFGDGVPEPDPNGREPDPGVPVESSRIVHTSTAFGTTYLDFVEASGTTTTGPLFAPASVPAPMVYQLTGDPGGDLDPSWHPHGSRVVFDSDRGQAGNRDIYVVEANGAGVVRLTQDPAADRSPDWELKGGGCLNPQPYSPRPGTQTRTDRRPSPQTQTQQQQTQQQQTTGQSTGPGRTPHTTTSAGAAALRVTGLRVTKAGKGTRRSVVVRFVVNKQARASLRLLNSRRTVARRLGQPLPAGSATIRLNVPRSVHGGRYRLRLTVTAGSTTLAFGRKVRIRSLRARR